MNIQINIGVKVSDDNGTAEEAEVKISGDVLKIAGVLKNIFEKYASYKEAA
jgi:hypothetical protein